MSINIDPEKIYKKLYQAGTEWSTAHTTACLLEEAQKSMLSTIVCQNLEKGAKSVSEADIRAKASQEYKDYIKGMVMARGVANDYKVRYDAAKVWWEAQRTMAATLRQELKTLPGVQ